MSSRFDENNPWRNKYGIGTGRGIAAIMKDIMGGGSVAPPEPTINPFQTIVPNQYDMIASQLSRGGYGAQPEILDRMHKQYTPNPNQYKWFYDIVGQGNKEVKKDRRGD